MQDPRLFIKRACADTVCTVQDVVRPIAGTFAGIYVPYAQSFSVTDVVCCLRRVSVREGLRGTIFSTLATGFAKLPDTKFDRPIHKERQIRKNFSKPNPGTELWCEQHRGPSQFSQPGIDSQRNAAGSIIAAGNGFVTETANVSG